MKKKSEKIELLGGGGGVFALFMGLLPFTLYLQRGEKKANLIETCDEDFALLTSPLAAS